MLAAGEKNVPTWLLVVNLFGTSLYKLIIYDLLSNCYEYIMEPSHS